MKNNEAVLKKYLSWDELDSYAQDYGCKYYKRIIDRLCIKLAAKDEENDNLIGKIEYAISILFDTKIKTGDKDHLLEILD